MKQHIAPVSAVTIISSRCIAASPVKDVWGQQSHAEKCI